MRWQFQFGSALSGGVTLGRRVDWHTVDYDTSRVRVSAIVSLGQAETRDTSRDRNVHAARPSDRPSPARQRDRRHACREVGAHGVQCFQPER